MGKQIRRLLLGLLLVLLVIFIVGGIAIGSDALGGISAADVTNVTYTAADGTALVGYLAQPPAGPAGDKAPAVLMVHEWWGLNAEIREMADILAAEGYVVLAPDTYRGRVATTIPGALVLRLSVPVDRVNSDMQAAYTYLTSLDNVDMTRVGVMGFCYGGGVAMRHATQNGQIAATINLYGDTISDPTKFGALTESGKPLLGIFASEDRQIPVSEVEAFKVTLAKTTIPHEVTIYPGVDHAFVNPANIKAGGEAAKAWERILAFFAATLKASA